MKKLLGSLCLLTVMAILIGCEKPGVPDVQRAKVFGKITYEGKPLPTGTITFDALNGQAPGSFNILDGSYDGLAPVGKNKVIITSFRKVSIKDKMGFDGPGYDTPQDENMLPARYSTGSQIEKEVTAQGPNEFNFDLKKD